MSHPIVEDAFSAFSKIGQVAVLVELKFRLLANKIPEVQNYATAKNLSETEAALLPYLLEKGLITESESNHIELSRKIRNKIFHCEFESAVRLVEELRGSSLQHGSVTGARIDDLPGSNILEKILNFATSVQTGKSIDGTFKVENESTKQAGIFGWLIEAHTKGLLIEGQSIANDSLKIIDRVFDSLAKIESKI